MPGPSTRFSEGERNWTEKGLSPKELPDSRGGKSQNASLKNLPTDSFSPSLRFTPWKKSNLFFYLLPVVIEKCLPPPP